MNSATKKYRRPKFTLKGLLLFVMATVVLLNWSTRKYFQMQAEGAYLAHLKRCLGEVAAPIPNYSHHRKASESKTYLDRMLWVKYDYQYDRKGEFQDDAVPPGPQWLRRHVGDKIFTRVKSLVFSTDEYDDQYAIVHYRHVDPDVLDGIERLHQLEELAVYVENLPSLANLEHLDSLEELSLRTGRSFPVNLSEISVLSSLMRAKIEGPTISEGESRTGQSKLQNLELIENHSITDLEDIGFAKNLIELKIVKCNRLRSLKGIEKFKSLRKLSLSNCDSLESLEGIENAIQLRILKLFATPKMKTVDLDRLPPSMEQLHLF